MSQTSKQTRIFIAGAGPVGLTAALELTRRGYEVRIVDNDAGPSPESRALAINPRSLELLEPSGVTERILATALHVHGVIIRSAGHELARIDTRNLGHRFHFMCSLAQSETEKLLIEALGERQVAVAWQTPLHSVEPESGSDAIFCNGEPYDLLIGADGAHSPVRQAAGIPHEYTPYGDMGVVAHLNIGRPHQNRAFQWFTGDAVFAVLPLPDSAEGPQASLVWSLHEGMAREWLAMSPETQDTFFAARALSITGNRLGRLALRTRPQGFSLSLERSTLVAPGVALVGDAAHRVHPLAGQGLNLGLADVQALADVLQRRESYRSVGDERLLARYRRARAQSVWAMTLVTHGLHRLFGTDCAPVAWARNAGMRMADDLPFLKRRLIQAAAGR